MFQFNSDLPVHLLLNDPTTPDLVEDVPVSPVGSPPFAVIGFDGGGNPWDSFAGRAGCCHEILAGATSAFATKAGSFKWAATDSLLVQPAAGVRLNAFYDRKSLQFFFGWDSVRQKQVFASASADVVAHELGHALLDVIRPELWGVHAFEIGAFHEAFADIHALVYAASHEKLLRRSLDEVGNDLGKSSTWSRMAEEMGAAVYSIPDGRPFALRDGMNAFPYVKPEILPRQSDPKDLKYEIHSFSRVLTGSIYEIIAKIYYQLGGDGVATLQHAVDVVWGYAIESARVMPINKDLFQGFAHSMLAVDRNAGSKYQDILSNVFSGRWFFKASAQSDVEFVGEPRGEMEVRECREEIVLGEQSEVRAAGENPLYSVQVNLPLDAYKVEGLVVSPDRSDSLAATGLYLDHVWDAGLVSQDGEFEIEDKKLIRKRFFCCLI